MSSKKIFVLAVDYLPLLAAPFIGSFLAALAYRMPRNMGFVFGRSRCDDCGATLKPVDLMPILSWLWHRGRCGYCGQAIAVDNLLLELSALAVAIWASVILDGWLFWVQAV